MLCRAAQFAADERHLFGCRGSPDAHRRKQLQKATRRPGVQCEQLAMCVIGHLEVVSRCHHARHHVEDQWRRWPTPLTSTRLLQGCGVSTQLQPEVDPLCTSTDAAVLGTTATAPRKVLVQSVSRRTSIKVQQCVRVGHDEARIRSSSQLTQSRHHVARCGDTAHPSKRDVGAHLAMCRQQLADLITVGSWPAMPTHGRQ